MNDAFYVEVGHGKSHHPNERDCGSENETGLPLEGWQVTSPYQQRPGGESLPKVNSVAALHYRNKELADIEFA